MANQDLLTSLKISVVEDDGCQSWNKWRREYPDQYIDLSNSDLQQLNLVGANLNGANLCGCDLENVILYEAKLEDANLKGANLKGAKLGKVFDSGLREAYLNRADLSEANLNKAYLHGVQLRQARLTSANLIAAHLNEADLWEADLTDAKLQGASVNGANLDGAVLDGAWIEGLSGTVSSAVNIHCEHLDIGIVLGREIVEFTDKQNVEELGRYLAQEEQQRIHFLIHKFQQQRHPLIGITVFTAKDNSRYEIIQKLDENIVSVAYRARHLDDGSNCILHVLDLNPHYIQPRFNKELRQRFIIQGLKSRQINHPHILKVLSVAYLDVRPVIIEGQEKSRPFWVLEDWEGEMIEKWLSERQAGFVELLPLMIQLASALNYLHRTFPAFNANDLSKEETGLVNMTLWHQGIPSGIHGNMNPATILIDREGEIAKISQASVVRWQDIADAFADRSSFSDSARLPSIFLRCYQYMSPEQKRGTSTRKSDIFSLGLVFYYMATRQHYIGDLIAAKWQDFTRVLQESCWPIHIQKVILEMVNDEGIKRPELPVVLRCLQPGRGKRGLYRAVVGVVVLSLVGTIVFCLLKHLYSLPKDKGIAIVPKRSEVIVEGEKPVATPKTTSTQIAHLTSQPQEAKPAPTNTSTQEKNAAFFFKRGLALQKLNRLREAKEDLVEVIQLEPQNAAAYVHIGDIYIELKRPQRSLEYWRTALQLNHDDKEGIYRRLLHLVFIPDVTPDMLAKLAEIERREIQSAVAKNRLTPASAIVKLAQNEDIEIRMAAAYHDNVQCRIQIASDTNARPDVLAILACDRESIVRIQTAQNPSTPREILLQLTSDKEEAVKNAAKTRDTKITRPDATPPEPVRDADAIVLTSQDWPDIPMLVEKALSKERRECADGKYFGQIRNGKLHGFGTYTWNNGIFYTGLFQYDQPHGCGIFTWPDGRKYTGECRQGRIEGQGIWKFADNSEYRGEWLNNKKHGKGIYIWANGEKYEGYYCEDQMHGYGTYSWPDGQTYTGEYRNGKCNGKGRSLWPNGNKYEGEFANGQFHGHGVYSWADGRKYTGQYLYAQPNGKGIYLWPSGNKYEGEFLNGQLHGYGILYRKDGSISKQGLWKNGQFSGD